MGTSVHTQAKTQFIRVVDRLADMRKVSWKVVGDFVRNMISPDDMSVEEQESSKLEFMMTNKCTTTGTIDIINDLFVMKYITHWVSNDCTIDAKVQIYLENTKVEINCVFHERYYSCVLASDQIVLTQSGLSLLYYGEHQDSYNMNKGIALVQRLGELREKHDSLVMMYTNSPTDNFVRLTNSKIMRKQYFAIKKGYTVTGNVLLIDNKEKMCPICYEKQCTNAVLDCLHTFCVECLASHMERMGESHSKCPLCRQPLILKMIDQM